MNDKKIYKWLQIWFPELEYKKVPKEKQRRDFAHFKAWMVTEKDSKKTRSFLMSVHPEHIPNNTVASSAVLQDLHIDLDKAHFEIIQSVQPILLHYELNRESIGKNYKVQEQATEKLLSKIYELLKSKQFKMLLIYADQYYWIAVPEHAEKVNKFCKKFEKQFKADDIHIELFSSKDCMQST